MTFDFRLAVLVMYQILLDSPTSTPRASFSQGETLRVACFPIGVQVGTGRQSLMGKTPYSPSGILRQALASPFGIWGATAPLVVPRVE
ncbi:MAG: hypothetical protein V7K88_03080 [Nostoc sp.]|uniref:hypothetical protein n=1 Tax=Nostoc sp. TaxID=1180 RepID=UPI002FF4A974